MKLEINEKVIVPNGDIGIVKDYMKQSNCYNIKFEKENISLWIQEDCLKGTEMKQYNIFDFIK